MREDISEFTRAMKFGEDGGYGLIIQFIRCDLSKLSEDIACYFKISRGELSDKVSKGELETKISQACDRITKATQLIRDNIR